MFLVQAAQAVAQAIPDAMSPTLVPAQFTGSTLVVWLIDWMKRSNKIPFLNESTAGLNRLCAVIGAAITAAGIHFSMEATSAGVYTISLANISFETVTHFIQGFAVSIATQQTILKVYQITNTLRKIAGESTTPPPQTPNNPVPH